jgi:ATP-dependent RNA helicase DDX19/DBP5
LKKWEDLKMHDDILTGILEYGFAKPSSIQAVAIPLICEQPPSNVIV